MCLFNLHTEYNSQKSLTSKIDECLLSIIFICTNQMCGPYCMCLFHLFHKFVFFVKAMVVRQF